MSVGIWYQVEGKCECSEVKPVGYQRCCRHYIGSDWGTIEFTCPRPDRSRIGHLMLELRGYTLETYRSGPRYFPDGRVISVEITPRYLEEPLTENSELRVFTHLDYGGKRWTWEMFEAHWTDDRYVGPELLIGRWPD